MGRYIMRLVPLERIVTMLGEPLFITNDYTGTSRWEIVKEIDPTDGLGVMVCESGLKFPLSGYGVEGGWSAYEKLMGMSAVKLCPPVRKACDFRQYCRDHKGQEVLVVSLSMGGQITVQQDAIKEFLPARDCCSASYVLMWSGRKYPTYNWGEAWNVYEYERPILDTNPQPPAEVHHTGDTKFCSKCGKAHSTYSETFKSWTCMDCGHLERDANT